MIAADTSSMVAYLSGQSGEDVQRVVAALTGGELVLPPAVVTEILSGTDAPSDLEADLADLISVPLGEGYWTRAGLTRRKLHKNGLKAKVADALIAQFCIDNDLALITRDRDFRHFARHCGLKLA